MREKMPNVWCVLTATMEIDKAPNQCFYKTPRAWEIWEDGEFARRIKRIPSSSVLWVVERDLVPKSAEKSIQFNENIDTLAEKFGFPRVSEEIEDGNVQYHLRNNGLLDRVKKCT